MRPKTTELGVSPQPREKIISHRRNRVVTTEPRIQCFSSTYPGPITFSNPLLFLDLILDFESHARRSGSGRLLSSNALRS